MSTHPFVILMVITFIAAIATMLAGVVGMAKGQTPNTASTSRSTQLMALRVGLCALLLLEIIIYVNYFPRHM